MNQKPITLKNVLTLFILVASIIALLGLNACQKDQSGTAQSATEGTGQTLDQAADNADATVAETGDAVEESANAAQETMEDAGSLSEAAGDAAETVAAQTGEIADTAASVVEETMEKTGAAASEQETN